MEELIKDFGNLFKGEEIKDFVLIEAYAHLEEIMNKWTESHHCDFTGGKMRSSRGNDIESFICYCVDFIANHEDINLVAKKGMFDKKTIEINEIKKDHQIDIHIYYNDKFVAVVECKAYLDHCMYIRACDDFKIFKKFGYTLKNAIFALEDNLEHNSKVFSDHVNENICDHYFCILDGKRNSSKPIYDKRFKKDINKKSLKDFIDFIYKLTETL